MWLFTLLPASIHCISCNIFFAFTVKEVLYVLRLSGWDGVFLLLVCECYIEHPMRFELRLLGNAHLLYIMLYFSSCTLYTWTLGLSLARASLLFATTFTPEEGSKFRRSSDKISRSKKSQRAIIRPWANKRKLTIIHIRIRLCNLPTCISVALKRIYYPLL